MMGRSTYREFRERERARFGFHGGCREGFFRGKCLFSFLGFNRREMGREKLTLLQAKNPKRQCLNLSLLASRPGNLMKQKTVVTAPETPSTLAIMEMESVLFIIGVA
ncbi:hypothetical protein L1049_018950 [Liquidambar formosana]|uniref:Uncharacterized protein n=1 Tax=Liquidambar formosana TaxID=63359 RepID=A0AAP0WNT7_LIQFO